MKHRPSGIKVDTKALAKEFYNDIFTPEDRQIVAYGMLPAEKMRSAERLLGEKFESCAKDQAEAVFGTRPDNDCADEVIKKKFVRDITHEISVEIYAYADGLGKMKC